MIKNGHRPATRQARTSQAPPFQGAFETHLTVRDTGADGDRAAGLERYAAARGLKWVHIVLERGSTPSQPMLTLHGNGPADLMRARSAAEAAELRAAGFEVVRTKIETTPWADGVPVTDAAAAVLGPAHYFEHHVKLLLSPAPTGARTGLADLVAPHAAHLSRNARRIRSDGREERFVTQRCRAVGRDTAERRLATLLAALRATGHDIASVEREFVVHDSNEALDDGWIDETSTYAAGAGT
ncbi:hypothetical protein [Streptomyces rimosus]|uniref:hypothetical protein n=1 Tax=Streptomyces rimosus TaxID=1927 RepID=UPI0004C4C67F|nr:hypothetical protein [Streptomyces rimosus]